MKFWNMTGFLRYQNGLLLNKNVMVWNQNAALRRSVEEKLGLPPKPKRPLTPYFRFLALVRPDLLKKNPEANPTEIVKLAAQQWRKVDVASKEKFDEEFKKDMIDFLEAKVKYDQALTEDQHEEIRQAKIEKKEDLERQKLKKKMKELGKPKRPITPFLQFLHENKEIRGQTQFRDWQQRVAKMWEALPEEQKSYYIEQNKENIEKYRKDLKMWEEKMIREGHIDVVRSGALIEPNVSSRPARYKKVGA